MADSTPVSWKQGGRAAPGEEEAARVVRLAAQLEPRPVDRLRGWDDVVDRHARRRSSASRVLAFAAAAACGALLVWAGLALRPQAHEPGVAKRVMPPPAPAPVVAVAPAPVLPQTVEPTEERVGRAETAAPAQSFTASPGSQWTKGRSGVVHLEAGHFEAKASLEQPQRVQTPEVSLVATQARFAMDVTEQGTTVAVFEGTAEVSSAHAKATLHAGQTRHWGAQPAAAREVEVEVQPVAVAPVALGDGACQHVEAVDARLTCLASEARGGDLKAQAALFEEAALLSQAHRPAGAAEALRESLHRFPDGVLAPEVQLSLMRLLAAQQDYDGAIAAGNDFLGANPDDPRTEEVQGFVSRMGWLRAR